MEIQSTECECPRGEYKCSHAAALYIHGIYNLSRTDIECQWKRKKSFDVQSAAATDLFPSSKRLKPITREPNDEDRSFLYKGLATSGRFTGLYWLMSPEVSQQEPISTAPQIDDVIKEVLAAKSNDKSALFLKIMALDETKILRINEETIGQRENILWHSVRKGRLTASNFGLAIRAKKFTPSLRKQLLGQNDLQSVKALSWGIDHEEEAVKQFCEQSGKKVTKCGIWLDKTGLLGASPDGIVDGNATLEVKCPFSLRDDFVSSGLGKPSFFLTLEGENLTLKKNHRYWHQVQGQLYLSGMNLCYFVVWTKKEVLTLKIEKDENWNVHINQLRSFYIKYLFPEWCLYMSC